MSCLICWIVGYLVVADGLDLGLCCLLDLSYLLSLCFDFDFDCCCLLFDYFPI